MVQEIYCPDPRNRIAQGTNSPVGGMKAGVFQLVRGPGATLEILHVLEIKTLPCSGHYITNGIFLSIKVQTLVHPFHALFSPNVSQTKSMDTVMEKNVV